MIDTHTHLNFEAFKDDWREVVEKAVEAGVEKMIVVGTDIVSSKRAVEMAESHPALYASVGIHPHHVRDINVISDIKVIEKLAEEKRVVAIGEVGLDYHNYTITKYPITNDPGELTRLKILQKRLLGMQVEIAKKLNKPLILHSREAGSDVLDTIEHFAKIDGIMPEGVFHCFDGNGGYALKILEAGFYISFTGNVTFVTDRMEVAAAVPLDKLLLETDCPYMSPFAKASGDKKPRRCEPIDVAVIASYHAQQRQIDILEVEKQTTKNAMKLFRL